MRQNRRPPRLRGPGIAAAVSLLMSCGVVWSAPLAPADSPADIVVSTPRGSVGGGIDPVLQISPSELDSYGNADHDVLPALGHLSGTFNATVDEVSEFGTLWSTSYRRGHFDLRAVAVLPRVQ
jgi:hypothetical protein